MKLSPESEALAFRIWAYANPLGWDCTYADAADYLKENRQRVVTICSLKGWTHRFRAPPSAGKQSMAGQYVQFATGGVAGMEQRHQTEEMLEELRFESDA